MNKIVIPAILAATVLVAGMFALMPVQKASTVHTAITAAVSDLDGDGVPNAVDKCPLTADPTNAAGPVPGVGLACTSIGVPPGVEPRN